MTTVKLGIMFAGAGIFSASLPDNCHVAWVIEYNEKIAAIYAKNNPDSLTIVRSVEDIDYSTLPGIDILQCSPECKEFSIANYNQKETVIQTGQADAICRALVAIRPRFFILENVRGYMGSNSIKKIGQTLLDLDYCVDQQIINAADYGVPQSRVRLILRARSGGFMGTLPPIPGRVKKQNGWFNSIQDIIPILPKATLPKWQEKRFYSQYDTIKSSVFMIDGKLRDKGRNISIVMADKPAATVVASHGAMRDTRIWLSSDNIVRSSPRVAARFQTIPDSFVLPDNIPLAMTAIGNGIPSLFGRRLIESFQDV